VRKQDTAALNTHALVACVEELGIKQYWLARKLEVTTRTVNRWMTGKVKRISRDNLDRMVEVLKTTHEALTTADEGDVFATRAEQTKAAHLLVSAETEALFHTRQQFAAYEQLLKATLHPDLTLRQLAVMYNQLLIVNAMQRKYDEARQMAERAIDYAVRCGDVPHEMSARTSMAVIDAEQGLLGEARKKFELLMDLHESVGSTLRYKANIAHNLGTAYRLIGEMKKAVEMSNLTIEYYSEFGRVDFSGSAYQTCGLLARDIGQHAAAEEFFQASYELHKLDTLPREQVESMIYILESRSLQGEPAVATELPPLLERMRGFTYFGDNYHVAAAGTFRRAGEIGKAEEVLADGLASPSTRRYERPLLLQEQARCCMAKGNRKAADKLLAEANVGFKQCGMTKRLTDDPALEVGEQYRRGAARLKLLFLPSLKLKHSAAKL
jgi:tetratricopeptide (TPR) repeat protein